MSRKHTSLVLPSPVPGLLALQLTGAQRFPRHSHDLHGLGLIDRGGQRSASGRGPVQAIAGQLITVNPGEVHDGAALDERGRDWRMLYLEPALMTELGTELGRQGASAALLTPPVLDHAPLHRALQRLFAALQAGQSALAIETLLQGCLHQLLPVAGLPLPAPGGSAAVGRAREMLHADLRQTPGLAALAAACGLSRYQLLRHFARCYGLPPHAYLLQQRLALARRLIQAGSPLADAAADAGFADQSHLHRAFVRWLGLTPGAYRAAISFKTAGASRSTMAA